MSFRTAVSDLFHDRAAFDIIGKRRVFFLLSALALAISAASLGTRGLNFGIDFEGGTAWQVDVDRPRVSEVRDVLRPLGLGEAKVIVVGGSSVRVQAEVAQEKRKEQVTEALAKYAGVDPAEVSFKDVGPTFGAEVTDKAVRALVFFLVAVSLYLALRFELKMALAALAALAHDVGITVGVYSLSGFEVTPATVVAILTILGYSLYDTVVVFDKVAENASLAGSAGRQTYAQIVNRSVNETLMRSFNTSFTTVLPVLSLLLVGSGLLGALSIRDFALALLVGLVSGTYSSVFTAAPILAVLKEREPRYRAARERAEARVQAPAPASVAAHPGDGQEEATVGARAPSEPVFPGFTGPGGGRPRGRQRRRKKRRR